MKVTICSKYPSSNIFQKKMNAVPLTRVFSTNEKHVSEEVILISKEEGNGTDDMVTGEQPFEPDLPSEEKYKSSWVSSKLEEEFYLIKANNDSSRISHFLEESKKLGQKFPLHVVSELTTILVRVGSVSLLRKLTDDIEKYWVHPSPTFYAKLILGFTYLRSYENSFEVCENTTYICLNPTNLFHFSFM
jgi:hypothetical protein